MNLTKQINQAESEKHLQAARELLVERAADLLFVIDELEAQSEEGTVLDMVLLKQLSDIADTKLENLRSAKDTFVKAATRYAAQVKEI